MIVLEGKHNSKREKDLRQLSEVEEFLEQATGVAEEKERNLRGNSRGLQENHQKNHLKRLLILDR